MAIYPHVKSLIAAPTFPAPISSSKLALTLIFSLPSGGSLHQSLFTVFFKEAQPGPPHAISR